MEGLQVIVVDNESRLLSALKRTLRMHAKEWTLHTTTDPREALEKVSDRNPLVVISETRLPHTSGPELFEQLRLCAPLTLRVFLSASATDDVVLNGAGLAHAIIPKPFALDDVIRVLNTARRLQELPLNPAIREHIGSLTSLPAVPNLYSELKNLLADPASDLKDAANLISRDGVMLGKILQIANSPFFGFASPSASANDAVVRLGSQMVCNLVLYHGLFNPETQNTGRCLALAQRAEQVAEQMVSLGRWIGLSQRELNHCYQAGVLHNLSARLIDTTMSPELQSSASAYLLELWNLEPEIAKAVLFQNAPLEAEAPTRLCGILHTARCYVDACLEGRESELLTSDSGLDQAALKALGILPDVQDWHLSAIEANCTS